MNVCQRVSSPNSLSRPYGTASIETGNKDTDNDRVLPDYFISEFYGYGPSLRPKTGLQKQSGKSFDRR